MQILPPCATSQQVNNSHRDGGDRDVSSLVRPLSSAGFPALDASMDLWIINYLEVLNASWSPPPPLREAGWAEKLNGQRKHWPYAVSVCVTASARPGTRAFCVCNCLLVSLSRRLAASAWVSATISDTSRLRWELNERESGCVWKKAANLYKTLQRYVTWHIGLIDTFWFISFI